MEAKICHILIFNRENLSQIAKTSSESLNPCFCEKNKKLN